MNSPTLLSIRVLLLICAATSFAVGQSQRTPPNLSGNWSLVDGSLGSGSPLGSAGTITQDTTTITFRPSAQTRSMTIPLDGSKSASQDDAYVWEYQSQWVGYALVISMKASTGRTPANFEDLMVVSLSGADTMTMVIMRTPKQGRVMNPYTLTYKKS